jgi:putative DNA primase/helicase
VTTETTGEGATFCPWCCDVDAHRATGACASCKGKASDARSLCDRHRAEGEAERARDGYSAILSGEERPVLDPRDPYSTAREFVRRQKHLLHHAGSFYRWSALDNYWPSVEDKVVRSDCWAFLSEARKEVTVKGKKGDEDRVVQVPFSPSSKDVSEVLDAAGAQVVYPKANTPPCWLDGREKEDVVAFRNGLLRSKDRALLPPDPLFYNHTSLPFDYDPSAPEPAEWLKFLASLWPEDKGEAALLQEVFGYLVSGDTRMQKIFMMVGPKRSGKGTIGRVLRQMLGPRNVAGPTLESMGEVFGRECLIGKTLALIADARLHAHTKTAAVVEELLAISGEDPRSIQRKYLPSYDAPIPVRFLLLTNELPRLEDASGALASRFVILQMTRSFYGHEDLGLQSRLNAELPGILNWSLAGMDRLRARGYFQEPESVREIAREFEDLGSPINAFLKDRCVVTRPGAPQAQVTRTDAWEAWQDWCREQGRDHPGALATFGRNLRAAIPHIKDGVSQAGGKKVRSWVGFGLLDEREQGLL